VHAWSLSVDWKGPSHRLGCKRCSNALRWKNRPKFNRINRNFIFLQIPERDTHRPKKPVSWLNRPERRSRGRNWGAWFPRYNIYRNIACTVSGHSIHHPRWEFGKRKRIWTASGPTPIWCHSTCGSGVRYSGRFSYHSWTKPNCFSVSTLISVFTPLTYHNKHTKLAHPFTIFARNFN